MLSDFDAELEAALESYSDAPAEARGRTGKQPAAKVLSRIAQERYRFGTSTTGEPFAVPLSGPRIVLSLRGAASLRAELAAAYLRETGTPPPQQALADTLIALEGIAATGTSEYLALRVADCDGVLWLDLGDTSGDVARIGADGWSIHHEAPILHRRTALTAPLPRPATRGDLGSLWDVLNVSEPDRAVLVAFLVAALMPDMPHPVLLLTGEQGTGKSSAARIIGSCVDPSTVPNRKPPRDADSWITAAQGSHLVSVDNLSALPDWLSDALCRASTGDGDVKRKLYSDGDLYVFAFRRVVILNGIDLGAIRDDLADRLVTVELQRIPEQSRARDADLAERWAATWPRVLAGLLDLTVQVLDRMPRIHLDRSPRMADFARVLATVDAILGTTGLERYAALAGELASDAVANDPVLSLLPAVVAGDWTGATSELLDDLNAARGDGRPPRDWPASARALTGVLSRRAPSLRRFGWTVEKVGGHTKRGQLWHLKPPAPGDETGDESDDGNARHLVRHPVRHHEDHPMTSQDTENGSKGDGVTDNTGFLSVLSLEDRRESGDLPSTREAPFLSSPRHRDPDLLDPELLDAAGHCRVHHDQPVAGCWTCDALGRAS